MCHESETLAPVPPDETWLDWAPSDYPPESSDLLTREGVLDLLKERQILATERNLRSWEYLGVLPRPILRHYGGAPRALYPEWIVELVWWLGEYRARGLTLSEIQPLIRKLGAAVGTVGLPAQRQQLIARRDRLAAELQRAETALQSFIAAHMPQRHDGLSAPPVIEYAHVSGEWR